MFIWYDLDSEQVWVHPLRSGCRTYGFDRKPDLEMSDEEFANKSPCRVISHTLVWGLTDEEKAEEQEREAKAKEARERGELVSNPVVIQEVEQEVRFNTKAAYVNAEFRFGKSFADGAYSVEIMSTAPGAMPFTAYVFQKDANMCTVCVTPLTDKELTVRLKVVASGRIAPSNEGDLK